jgi:hypothetical protein
VNEADFRFRASSFRAAGGNSACVIRMDVC